LPVGAKWEDPRPKRTTECKGGLPHELMRRGSTPEPRSSGCCVSLSKVNMVARVLICKKEILHAPASVHPSGGSVSSAALP